MEAEPEGWKNPIRKVKAPKIAVDPLSPVELDTVKALMNTCKRETMVGARDNAILLALLDTGARASEFCDMLLDVVDLITGAILFRQERPEASNRLFRFEKPEGFTRIFKAATR